jgi:hypothetical protein
MQKGVSAKYLIQLEAVAVALGYSTSLDKRLILAWIISRLLLF